MSGFKEYFTLQEALFKKSKHNVPVVNLPMFSVFLEKEKDNSVDDVKLEELKNTPNYIKHVFSEARKEIHKIGFPSMHVNVVIADLKQHKSHTGENVSGLAYAKRKFMKINYETFITRREEAIRTIVHEWAHLWMFNKGKKFREVISELYNSLILKDVPEEKIYEEFYYQRRSLLRKTIIYFINELAFNPIIRNLIKKEGDWEEEDVKRLIRRRISYSIESSLNQLKFSSSDIHNIPNIETLINELTERFYQSLINTVNNEDYKGITKDMINEFSLEDTKPENSLFYIYASSDLEKNIINIILEKVKEIFLEHKDKASLYDIERKNLVLGEAGSYFREYIREVMKWYNTYGLSNSDEFWATAIEGFFSLNLNHRRMIVKMILDN